MMIGTFFFKVIGWCVGKALQWVRKSRSKNTSFEKWARWVLMVAVSDRSRNHVLTAAARAAGWPVWQMRSVWLGEVRALPDCTANAGGATMKPWSSSFKSADFFPAWCKFVTFSNRNYVYLNLPFISEPYNWRVTPLSLSLKTLINEDSTS